MGVTRDVSKIMLAVPDYWVFTCGGWMASSCSSIYVTTGVFSSGQTTTTCGIDGIVIDRLSAWLGANYNRADVYGYLRTCYGSTDIAALKQAAIGVILEHATASGGTFVDFSTENWPGLRYVFSCAETTPMFGHTTGNLDGVPTKEWSVDITAAKRFLRATILTGKNTVTTGSCGIEGYRVGAMIAFREADVLPSRANTTGPGSTSTSTST